MDQIATAQIEPPRGYLKPQRMLGLDVARALAIAGMMLSHFCTTMRYYSYDEDGEPSVYNSSPIDEFITEGLSEVDGRPAALFMILAGIGVTLLTRSAVASGDPAAIAAKRRTLVIRGVLLLIAGYINLRIWPGDILRVYGVSMFVAATLITVCNRTLLLMCLGFVCAFIGVFCVLDYAEHWDWSSMAYDNQWSADGIVRHLFYDGFRSVLPWTGLMCFGMWLGRLKLKDTKVNTTLLLSSILVVGIVRTASFFLLRIMAGIGADDETATALFGTASMPPLPFFLLSAGGVAVFVIAACVRFVGDHPNALVQALADTGQMALTWYVQHIVIGITAIYILGMAGSTTLIFAVLFSTVYFGVVVIISYIWKRIFAQGPLEWGMRKIAG